MKKIIRISTVPISLNIFCKGLLYDLSSQYEIIAVSSPGEALDEIAARDKDSAAAWNTEEHHIEYKKNLIAETDCYDFGRTEPADHNGVEHIDEGLEKILQYNRKRDRKKRTVKSRQSSHNRTSRNHART